MWEASWYGEPMVTADEQAVAYLREYGKTAQGEALTDLSGGFDSYRGTAHSALARLISSGDVVMSWDSQGWPFYALSGRVTA